MDGAPPMTATLATHAINLNVRFPDFPDAACADPDVDPEVFFPRAGGGWDAAVAYARGICAGCPERDRCLAWAVEHNERGVWGGTSGPDRRSMKAGRPPLVCADCRGGFSDPGKPGPKPRRCARCRARRDSR
jgi:hypothetical protein